MSNNFNPDESLESFLTTHKPGPFKPSVCWEHHAITVLWKDSPSYYEFVNHEFGLFKCLETDEVVGVEINRRGGE